MLRCPYCPLSGEPLSECYDRVPGHPVHCPRCWSCFPASAFEDLTDRLAALESIIDAVRNGGILSWDEFASTLPIGESDGSLE